jgi:hypothetical protein
VVACAELELLLLELLLLLPKMLLSVQVPLLRLLLAQWRLTDQALV